MPTPLPPVDPDVKLPPGVAAASAKADAIHKQAYQTPAPAQPDPAPPAPALDAAPPPAPQPAPPPAQSVPAVPPVPPPAAGEENLTAEQWRHRYLSMEGRYKQSANTVGVMQEQMQELGDELMRTQQMVRSTPQPQERQPGQPVRSGVTEDDLKVYGPELIDLMTRAARDAVMPDMQNLHNGVSQVQQRVQQVSTGGVYQTLTTAVPNWREINNSPRFKQWCALRDVYSGAYRGNLLKAAFQAADAPRVVAFFKGFLTEEQATGQLPDPSLQPPDLVPRIAATTLDMLAAPGRAHPATGDTTHAPADKPIFTRQQIAAFYTAVRQGAFSGRDNDKNVTEQAIFAAQREGRVR